MKYFYKIVMFFFLLISSFIYSQNITKKDVNAVVHGIVYHGNEKYLVTNKGYIKVENTKRQKSVNDQWTEYYRKAHGDPTIKNPNTIIEQPGLNIPIRFFFPVGGAGWFDEEYGFDKDLFLYDFVQADEHGNYVFRPGILGIIGKMNRIPKGK